MCQGDGVLLDMLGGMLWGLPTRLQCAEESVASVPENVLAAGDIARGQRLYLYGGLARSAPGNCVTVEPADGLENTGAANAPTWDGNVSPLGSCEQISSGEVSPLTEEQLQKRDETSAGAHLLPLSP